MATICRAARRAVAFFFKKSLLAETTNAGHNMNAPDERCLNEGAYKPIVTAFEDIQNSTLSKDKRDDSDARVPGAAGELAQVHVINGTDNLTIALLAPAFLARIQGCNVERRCFVVEAHKGLETIEACVER